MVLSVSKTFLKLKDLILEKKTLEEQMTKMKHVNQTLCSQVNIHEEKLCGITGNITTSLYHLSGPQAYNPLLKQLHYLQTS